MKKILLIITTLVVAIATYAQRVPYADSTVTTKHQLNTFSGQKLSYTARTGTQPVWDEQGKPIAAVHYTYYTRDDVTNRDKRPLVISFNGGLGSGSVWMHLAYTGPRLLNIDDEGYPLQPYGVKENPYSILDVADIVYINPVNTGYSVFWMTRWTESCFLVLMQILNTWRSG